jgi:Mg-chelatase subunit ChlD
VLDDSDPADPDVVPDPAFEARSRAWLTPGNHNYRRLTRMLASLVVLGRRPLADALLRCLESLYRNRDGGEIGDHAISHWRRQLS